VLALTLTCVVSVLPVGLSLLVAMAVTHPAAAQAGEDGAAVYAQRCAACHDHPRERIPPLSAIKAMSAGAVQASLTGGSMREQARGLSAAQLAALIAYIGPKPDAAPAVALEGACGQTRPHRGHGTWNGWSTSPTGSRFQDGPAAGLAVGQLPDLRLKWAFNLGAVTLARAQPVVAGGKVYVTTLEGKVYSLDLSTGCSYWAFKADDAIRGAVTLGEGRDAGTVYFGDQRANVYAIDTRTGGLLWKVHPAEHPATTITATPRYHRGRLYQTFSSAEEVLAGSPQYPCCTFRGSVVALDAATGKTLWQSFTIPEAPKLISRSDSGVPFYGPSGAGVWSTPTIDEHLGVLYVATGDNYAAPATLTSDAVLAMDLATGALLWSRQLTDKDAYNLGCETPQKTHCEQGKGPDFDFGQPPILVSLGGGHRALVLAQKSGMAHAIDPDRKGEILWQTRVGHGSSLGGSQWGSASDGEKLYVAVSDITITGVAAGDTPGGFRLLLDPAAGGGLYALDLHTGKPLWNAQPARCTPERTACSPAQSAAVTVIPGAVFAGSLDGHLRAYSTQTGQVLWDVDTEVEVPAVNGKPAHGGSIDVGGPVVVDGMVLVASGYGQWGGTPGNALLAFSVKGR
jgi:polyvinyl alcohol dehydrogenase (cytochrome)